MPSARSVCVLVMFAGAVAACLHAPPCPGADPRAEPLAAAPAGDAPRARSGRVPPVPEGTPAELFAYVERLFDPALLPETRGRQRYYRKRAAAATVEAADRILAQVRPGDTDHATAVALKFDALEALSADDVPGADTDLAAFATTLVEGPDADLAARARRLLAGRLRLPALVGKPLPLDGPLLGGAAFDPRSLAGKVVLVDFWATWCGPCLAEIPNLLDLHETYHARGFEVVGVSLDEDVAALEAFVADRGLPWPIIVDGARDGGETLASRYGITGIPRMILLDRDGTVRDVDARGGRLAELLADAFADDAP